jgi:hypothetical protein
MVWLITGLLATNPIYLLIVLAAIPDRAKQRLRNQFRRELDAKLAAMQRRPSAQATIAKVELEASAQSIGDQPTRVPRERSIGDEETRM